VPLTGKPEWERGIIYVMTSFATHECQADLGFGGVAYHHQVESNRAMGKASAKKEVRKPVSRPIMEPDKLRRS